MTTPTENWKNIPGYEGRYQVSDLGRVRHLPRRIRFVSKNGNEAWRTTVLRVCAPNVTREGYALAHLQVDGVRATPTVHELVLAAFVGDRPAGFDVNHINGVKTDNRLANLEYVTRSDNRRHAVRTGLNKQARAVVSSGGMRFPSISEAERAMQVSVGSVRYAIQTGKVCAGQTWSRA